LLFCPPQLFFPFIFAPSTTYPFSLSRLVVSLLLSSAPTPAFSAQLLYLFFIFPSDPCPLALSSPDLSSLALYAFRLANAVTYLSFPYLVFVPILIFSFTRPILVISISSLFLSEASHPIFCAVLDPFGPFHVLSFILQLFFRFLF
jgi:hypothetical protein